MHCVNETFPLVVGARKTHKSDCPMVVPLQMMGCQVRKAHEHGEKSVME